MRSAPLILVFIVVEFSSCTVDAQDFPAATIDLHLWPSAEHTASERTSRPMDSHQEKPESPLARAIARHRSKSLIESGVEASKKALIDCQEETSSTLTMPFGSRESQQAHCFRF